MKFPFGGDDKLYGQQLVKRDATDNVADVWGRIYWHHFLVEAEAALIWGHIGGVADILNANPQTPLDIRQVGGVGRFTYFTLHDTIRLKLEAGFASGDQNEAAPLGTTNYQDTPIAQPLRDHTITNFFFDPDYHVDLI